jgi:biotin carboxylase
MAQGKKLLILGGGYADIPLIKAAKGFGFYVITSGNRADDLGHQYSDECCLADFSDPQAMLTLARARQVDAVCACCNDFSALSAAYVAEQMGLPGHDSYQIAQTIHHKDRYRNFATEHDINSPRAEGFSTLEAAHDKLDQFQFPVIIKPVDLTGGKGISTVEYHEDPAPALKLAFDRSRIKRVVVEEFINGTRHGLSTFIVDGQVVFHFGDDEHYYLNPYMVSAASTPGNTAPEAIAALCKTAEKIASLLSLKTGIFHIQYILHDETPTIIEICRRAPGDLYTQFVHLASGVDYPSFMVRSAAGQDCSDLVQKPAKGYFTRHCIMSSRIGKVSDVVFDCSIQNNIIDEFMWWKPGDLIEDFLSHKLGIVFLQFDSMDEMLNKTQRMHDLIHVALA